MEIFLNIREDVGVEEVSSEFVMYVNGCIFY